MLNSTIDLKVQLGLDLVILLSVILFNLSLVEFHLILFVFKRNDRKEREREIAKSDPHSNLQIEQLRHGIKGQTKKNLARWTRFKVWLTEREAYDKPCSMEQAGQKTNRPRCDQRSVCWLLQCNGHHPSSHELMGLHMIFPPTPPSRRPWSSHRIPCGCCSCTSLRGRSTFSTAAWTLHCWWQTLVVDQNRSIPDDLWVTWYSPYFLGWLLRAYLIA